MTLKSDISPSVFRVFVAVVALAQAGKCPATVADVQRRLGYHSPNAVFPLLRRLAADGLIALETQAGKASSGKKGRTIRPLRRLELCEG